MVKMLSIALIFSFFFGASLDAGEAKKGSQKEEVIDKSALKGEKEELSCREAVRQKQNPIIKSKEKEGKEMFAYLEIYSPSQNKAQEIIGTIKVKLFNEEAPVTVKNFTDLATGKKVFKNYAGKEVKIEKNFYDGTIFHRIIPDFMVQGGDPTGTGRGDAGYKFDDEKSALKLKHTGPGILSMANAGPNSNGCQFFITHRSTPWLDGRHAVFGQVVEGMELINKMGNVQRDDSDKPLTDVVLKSVVIKESN